MYNNNAAAHDPYTPFPPPPTLSSADHHFNNYDAEEEEQEEAERRRASPYHNAYPPPPAPPPTPQDFWQQQQQQHHHFHHQQQLHEHLQQHHDNNNNAVYYYAPEARPLEHTPPPPPPPPVNPNPSGTHHGAPPPGAHGLLQTLNPGPYYGGAMHHASSSPYAHEPPAAATSHHHGSRPWGGDHMELPLPLPPHLMLQPHPVPGHLVTIHCKADPEFHLAVRPQQGVVMVPASPHDPYQMWIHDVRMSTRVKDSTGSPAFALINKATGQALRHAHADNEQVLLAECEMGLRDETTLLSQSEDMGDGYRCIRMINKITSNLEALHGDKKSGGIKDGTPVILCKWKKQENQIWKLTPA